MYFDNNKHIDTYFRKGLKDYSRVPDGDVWEYIERQLSQEKKVRQLFFIKVAAGLLIFIGLATFLAFEVLHFSGAQKEFASMKFNNELKNSVTGPENQYSGRAFNAMKDNQFIASDVSIPRDMLSSQGSQSHAEAAENGEISLHKKDSFAKMATMNVTFDNKTQQSKFIELKNQIFFNANKRPSGELSLQDKDLLPNSRQKENLFSLSGSFSPIMSYRNTKMTASNSAMSNETSMLSYSGGMNVGYSIGDKLTLRTGLHYAKVGQSLNDVEVGSESYALDGETKVIKVASSIGPGEINMNSLMQSRVAERMPKHLTNDKSVPLEFTIEPALYQTFEMVKMPFMLEYSLLDEKFNISMIAGVNANLLVNEGIYLEQAKSSQRIGSTEELRNLSYSGTFGIGLKYNVNKRTQLFMEPSFDYYITSLSSNNSYQTFPYYFGFFSGVSISF